MSRLESKWARKASALSSVAKLGQFQFCLKALGIGVHAHCALKDHPIVADQDSAFAAGQVL